VYRWLCVVIMLLATSTGLAQPSKEPQPSRPPQKESEPTHREQVALAFVREHHPSLAKLIVQLKQAQAKEYARAIADLSRTAERLQRIRREDEESFKSELSLWKARSEVELLVARHRLRPNDTVREDLKRALHRSEQMQLSVLMRQRARLEVRLRKIDAQIEQIKTGRDDRIARQIDKLLGRRAATDRRGESSRRHPPEKETPEPPERQPPSPKPKPPAR